MYFVSLGVVSFFFLILKRKHLLVSWMQIDLWEDSEQNHFLPVSPCIVSVSPGCFFFCFGLIYDEPFPQISRDSGLCSGVVSLFQRKRPFPDDGKGYMVGQRMAPHDVHILIPSPVNKLVYAEEDVIKIQVWSWGDCPGLSPGT